MKGQNETKDSGKGLSFKTLLWGTVLGKGLPFTACGKAKGYIATLS